MVEGFVSIFIIIGRIYRLNNGSVMESGPPSRLQTSNVVVAFLHAGNYRWWVFFRKQQVKKSLGEFDESVWKMIHLYSGTQEG